MIYLQRSTSTVQTVKLPVVHTDRVSDLGTVKLLLFSTVNRRTEVTYKLTGADFNNDYNADFAIAVNIHTSASGMYYIFQMLFDELPQAGEYTYTLTSETKGVLSKGAAVVGDYTSEAESYEITTEYKQYDGE